ncbi:hypothetical protein [Zavarzinella formosa]|uniref:hypothetical protein n=1 Tax=Zavarzinella formosa TaxID=360055 RepID=UPI0012FA3F20|nr:hypothetical protein [Zavarzinella formosa]
MSRLFPILGLILLTGCSSSVVQPPETDKIHHALDELAAGRGEWDKFSITYDDMHGFHGGLTLTIHGDGQIERQIVINHAEVQTGKTLLVPKEDLEKLLALLRELRVWEQRTAERTSLPDESRTELTIHYGDNKTTIWEWYNEMSANARIEKVHDLMSQLVRSQQQPPQ